MTATSSETSSVGESPCVVAYPDVTSSKEARTIGRLKLALELVSLGFLVMTVLFVWQITQKRPAAVQNPTVDPLKAEKYLTFKTSPCPIMMEKAVPPWLLPNEAQRSLFQADIIFDAFEGVQGLVGMTGNVVYQDRVVWRKNYGLKDKNHPGYPPDQDTVFRVASITKIFTAIFVFKLLETGRIDCLDDPLEKYEPRFQVKNPFNQQKITIRPPREVPCSDSYSYSKTHLCPVNNTYVLQQLKNTELKSPPGRLPHYSNLGYALIGRILAEKFANNDYEGWVQRNIFHPLGMRNTGFDLTRMSSNKAVGYDDDGEAPLVDWDWAAPAIQAYSTTNDLYKLMTLLLGTSSTTILKRDLVQQLMKPDFMYPDGTTVFGTGWEIKDVGTYSVVTKSGFVPGYSAGFAFVPEFKLGAVVLISGREVAWSVVHSIVETLAKTMDALLLRQQLQIGLLQTTTSTLESTVLYLAGCRK
ncbi:hypothetical protein OS493_008250 [Desmophyllum pertusum]|uniref:Beta-lactamase-related domain-containing protein n=1 Tax=Desmophyllum pertusum TaxID=174260 RepID=A0A9X0A404_9CNID|nr:hypothetical protein OS493_008250 [Desmophyllum pertusum]